MHSYARNALFGLVLLSGGMFLGPSAAAQNASAPSGNMESAPPLSVTPIVEDIDKILPGLGAEAQQLAFGFANNTGWSASLQGEAAADDAAMQAARKAQDWQGLRQASQSRLNLYANRSPEPWLDLAEADLNGAGPVTEALQAAYLGLKYAGHSNNPAAATWRGLNLMRQALGQQGNHGAEIRLLDVMVSAYPQEASLRTALDQAITAYGFVVSKVDSYPQSFPARACITFTVSLPHGTLHPGDYVTTQPAIKDLAVTETSGQLCLSGLTPGATTTVILHPGLPGIAGTALKEQRSIKITLANRPPALFADPSHFIIPANNPPAVGFSGVNISKVKVKIAHVSERSLLNFLSNHPLLNPGAFNSDLNGNTAPIIFTGSATVPGFERNRLVHAILPLSTVMTKPGLYAVSIAPDDGTPNDDGSLNLQQLVLRTNIAPTSWWGRNGLTVQLRRFTDASVIAGAKVALIASDNSVLDTAVTDSNGFAHFAAPLMNGAQAQAPVALHITGPDGDFTLVDLNAAPFDLTDRGVSGQAEPQPVDPYLWLDRGIYRPGETVNLGALLRDPALKPLGIPLRLIVYRPGGQVFLDQVTKWTDDSSFVTQIHLPAGAQAGDWSISLQEGENGPVVAQRSFTVAAFVPAKLAISFAANGPLAPGKIDNLPISVQFLYGAPGSDLTGTASVHVGADPSPFPAYQGYTFGLRHEIVNEPMLQPDLPETDATGAASIPIDLTQLPDTTHALQAVVKVTINDPSGRAATKEQTLKITPAAPMIGIRPGFSGGAVNSGTKPVFDIAAIAPDGKPVPMQADLSLVRQDYEWGVIWNDSVASWRYNYVNHNVLNETITITPGKPYHLVLPALPDGRYRLRLIQHSGGYAASSTIFYSGWITSNQPDVPTRLTVTRDKKSYNGGDVAQLHISAPFSGKAVLVLANDHVISTRDFDVPKGGTNVKVSVSASWGAGAYAIVQLYRPATATTPPDRAIGLVWLGLNPGTHELPVAFNVKTLYRPGRDVTFEVKTTPGAYVTLDAVDEGILSLTDFQSPDPLGHFFGKRLLGVDIRDDYGALLRPPQGMQAVLHVGGGGDFGPANLPIPQKIVSLFAGPVQAGPDGVARFVMHLPDFNGKIRLMAVAWKEDTLGSAATDIISRHKLIANLLLPRFLSPGDTANIGVMLQDLDLPSGHFTVTVAAKGAISGGKVFPVDLARGTRQVLHTQIAANAIGTGHIRLDVAGPDAYSQQRLRNISVHLVRPAVTQLTNTEVAPGQKAALTPDLSPFVPGSAKSVMTLGNHLPFDPAGFLQALQERNLPFLDESVSRGLPLTALTGAVALPDPQGRLAQAVENVLDDQRYDGAFGLWSSQDSAQPWLTAYATDFLLRARKAGADIPDPPLKAALSWLRHEVDNDPEPGQAQIYAAYVLALDGQAPAGAIRVMDKNIGDVTHPLARAQLGAALAMIGEPDRAMQALHAALNTHNRGGYFWWRGQDWNDGYGTPLRDAWAVPTIIRETGLMQKTWSSLAANLPGRGLSPDRLNSQELAAAGLAAADFGGKPETLSVSIDGKAATSSHAIVQGIGKSVTITNNGKTALPVVIATTGIPVTPAKAASNGMSLQIAFYAKDGTPLDVSRLDQNTVFIMVISGRATDSTPHHAVLTAGLPAGWELAGNISSGQTQLSWLPDLTSPDATASADDRYMAAFTLYPPCSDLNCSDNGYTQEFVTAVELRAVTQGHFILPGAVLADLNHPDERGTTAASDVAVLPPGTPVTPPAHASNAPQTKAP
ncbi:alpha-2-macroglobulin family protein [Acidocella aminolytica]|uniref:Alpha-2-macroglobulin domain-containing protein n=1 Tax=Acidocella aminolytica 101 = DSM 11237 TaxID=1120923 RepID=A0A0D6PE54_9PROT|nr:MG2 domain-containing protein [Acidocella aminolytica]GAN79488.1 alpha-2-macroglobulin domain-containing protein [Acidocella aminolytica 101 = DSM 11237]SHE47100.1 hypothetical protein SAMN02746095_00575 [Acidocella aminolytica 101 = DSM 11237]